MDYKQLKERVLRILRESREKAVEAYPPPTGNPPDPLLVGRMTTKTLEEVLPTHLYQKGLLQMVLVHLTEERAIQRTGDGGYTAFGGERELAPHWEAFQKKRASFVEKAEAILEDYPEASANGEWVHIPLSDFFDLLERMYRTGELGQSED